MPGTQQQLAFAIRAVNEANKALEDVSRQITDVGTAADTADGQLSTFDQGLAEVFEAAEAGGGSMLSFGSSLEGIAEFGGNAERALMGISDITGFLNDQFGISLGPINEYAGAFAQLGGGVEAALSGGPALLGQLKSIVTGLGPAIATTWAYVTALTAQAVAFIAANAPIILIIGSIALLSGAVFLLIRHWDDIVAKFPIIGTAADKAKEGFDKVTGAAKAVLDFMLQHWPEIAVLVSGPFAPIVLLATDAFGVRSAIQDAFTAVKDWVTSNWPIIALIISGPFAPLVLLATDAFGVRSAMTGAMSDLLSSVTGTVSDIGAAIGSIPGMLLGHIAAIGDSAMGVGKSIASGIIEGVKTIASLGATLGDYVLDAIRGAINQSLRWLHDNVRIEIPGFDPPGPGEIPGFTWAFPSMSFATGGITSGPMVAVVGDNPSGKEAIIPLDSPTGQRLLGGGGLTVIVQGSIYGVDDLMYVIDRAAKRAGLAGLT